MWLTFSLSTSCSVTVLSPVLKSLSATRTVDALPYGTLTWHSSVLSVAKSGVERFFSEHPWKVVRLTPIANATAMAVLLHTFP